jgi:exonuclease SbcD
LDACYAGAGLPAGFGNRRRQGLRDVLHAILERAATWPADAVLIAGDLFDLDRLNRDTVAFLRREFGALQPVPIFIAPGNHDPYTPDSPYAIENWPGNVHIFSSPQWTAFELEDKPLTVHGFAFDGPDISNNPFGHLEVPRDGRIHVAVAHGSERSHQPPGIENYAPFDGAQAAIDGLAYLALGHFHAMTPVGTRICYSGAPEGHGFDEPGVHGFLEVEISEEGARVAAVPSCTVVYSTHTIDCSDFTTAQQAVEAIRALPVDALRAQVARVTLTGTCAQSIQAGLGAIRDAVAPMFEHLELIDTTRPAEDYELLARENTTLGAFVRLMSESIRNAGSEEERRLRERAREVGLAAYRGHDLAIRGLRGNGR